MPFGVNSMRSQPLYILGGPSRYPGRCAPYKDLAIGAQLALFIMLYLQAILLALLR